MINPFEQLENIINDLKDKIVILDSKISSEKRWLNIKEASHYLGYSKDHLHKLKSDHLFEGVHYHKKAGRILFDKYELDNWVTTNLKTKDAKEIASDILEDLI